MTTIDEIFQADLKTIADMAENDNAKLKSLCIAIKCTFAIFN